MSQTLAIEMSSVKKSFTGTPILKQIDLQLRPSRFYCLIGESGSGKSTLMKLMNALLKPDSGRVLINGQAIDYSQSVQLRRSMGYAQQGSGLFPHLNIFENLSIVAKRIGWSNQDCLNRAKELLAKVNLDPEIDLQKYPRQMSGGEKQRVGIARALFLRPKIMIMDEAFGALDPNTRAEVQELFLKLYREQSLTVVLITHSLAEAFKMGDELILLNDGRIEQMGPPQEFLEKPKSQYVQDFVKTHRLTTEPRGQSE